MKNNSAHQQDSGPQDQLKLRTLLAEHSPALRQQLRHELEQLPFIDLVAEAQNSHEAITLFFRTRPQLVLVSISLPEESGFEILRAIKRAAADCLVIVTARWPDSFLQETARLLGAYGVCSTTDGFAQLRVVLQHLGGQPAHRKPQ